MPLGLWEGLCVEQPPGNDDIDSLDCSTAIAITTRDSRLDFGLQSLVNVNQVQGPRQSPLDALNKPRFCFWETKE